MEQGNGQVGPKAVTLPLWAIIVGALLLALTSGLIGHLWQTGESGPDETECFKLAIRADSGDASAQRQFDLHCLD